MTARASASGPCRIGIIGAGGAVGRIVCRILAARHDVSLVLAGRRTPTFGPEGTTPVARIESRAVDLFDDAALRTFVGGLQLVINCAGPSSLVGARVALAALDVGAHYLDPGGYGPLLRALAPHHQRAVRHGQRILVNAGLLPGLSGVLPAAIADGFDRVDTLECIYIGTDHWSLASAIDIVASLGDFGTERPPSFWRNGIRPAPWRKAFRRVDGGTGIGTGLAMMLMTEELEHLVQSRGIAHAAAWSCNHGPRSAALLGVTKFARLHRYGPAARAAARALVRASERDTRTTKPAFAILCRLAGTVSGKPAARTGRLAVGETYRPTAEATALAALGIIDGLAKPGVRMLHDAVEPIGFLDRFAARGYTIETADA